MTKKKKPFDPKSFANWKPQSKGGAPDYSKPRQQPAPTPEPRRQREPLRGMFAAIERQAAPREKGDLPRATIIAIARHLANAGAKSITRIDVSNEAWSAAYRFELPEGAPWGVVSAALETMGEDNQLVQAVGVNRGSQVVAEFALEFARGNRVNLEYASLSASEGFRVAMFQSASVASDWEQRYKNARVFALILYFR